MTLVGYMGTNEGGASFVKVRARKEQLSTYARRVIATAVEQNKCAGKSQQVSGGPDIEVLLPGYLL